MGLAEGLKINNTMHTIVLQDNFLDDAAVNNLEGYKLGTIIKIENHGASDLIFIDNKKGQEIIVPIENEFFKKFEKDNNLIIIDWEIDEN